MESEGIRRAAEGALPWWLEEIECIPGYLELSQTLKKPNKEKT